MAGLSEKAFAITQMSSCIFRMAVETFGGVSWLTVFF